MFRMWCKVWKDNRLVRDMVIERPEQDTRTHKVFAALEACCVAFDLEQPIWLDAVVTDFKRHGKARFTKDCFIESVEFDYLEIQVIEEDDLF